MKQAVFNKTAFIPVEIDMSVLTVSNVTHGFGARQILDDASFRLLKGEHVGLIGANGEGKSTFLNIITGKIPPDEGKIEWSNQVTVGYLDQHAVLEKGMTIRDVLQRAFDDLFVMEQNINDAYNRMGDVSEDEMNKLLEQVGEWQEILEQRGLLGSIEMLQSSVVVNVQRFCLQNYYWKNQLFCYWTNRQTILM